MYILVGTRSSVICQYDLVYRFMSKRFKKKTTFRPNKRLAPTVHTLNHFDIYYKPVYSKLWPSIRIALQSQQKYCALVNNFADVEEVTSNLSSQGAIDFMEVARKKVEKLELKRAKKQPIAQEETDAPNSLLNLETEHNEDVEHEELAEQPDNSDHWGENSPDLFDFMPTKKIMSEPHRQEVEEMNQNMYGDIYSGNAQVPVIEDELLRIPIHLKAFLYERGNVDLFPDPYRDQKSNHMVYVPMDAGSLLPVLALGLTPDCSVLDMCSAPGIKTFAMMQTFLLGNVLCLEKVAARLGRLKTMMDAYLPFDYSNKISIHCRDAIKFAEHYDGQELYDRILVDVPCNTDRTSASVERNNIFMPGRRGERLALQETQQDLLYWAIKTCKPGGIVVYSTCTLSPPQNDGIVQRALNKIWEETEIEVAVVNTKHFTNTFKSTFHFYNGCRYGQQVIPNLTSNFGPTYFCKIKRIS